MPPVVQAWIGSIIRTLLASSLGWFVAHGYVTESQSADFITWLVGVLLILGWSLWQKYVAARVQVTTQVMPKDSTELEVKEKIATGVGVPSVMTPATAVPVPVSAVKESLR